jgi:hypothetical protein
VVTIPAHQRAANGPYAIARSLVNLLRFDQRRLQVHRARIHVQLVLRLGAKHHARVPIPISATAHQQQAASVQADHSPSP